MITATKLQDLDVKHPYYCSNGNYYFSNECHFWFDSWDDFFEEQGDADLDYNLVFRWDLELKDEDRCNGNCGGGAHLCGCEANYLQLYVMHQRKGRFVSYSVVVTDEDAPKIQEYLKIRWEHMQKLWKPFN